MTGFQSITESLVSELAGVYLALVVRTGTQRLILLQHHRRGSHFSLSVSDSTLCKVHNKYVLIKNVLSSTVRSWAEKHVL